MISKIGHIAERGEEIIYPINENVGKGLHDIENTNSQY